MRYIGAAHSLNAARTRSHAGAERQISSAARAASVNDALGDLFKYRMARHRLSR
jgi:hypothetical protein